MDHEDKNNRLVYDVPEAGAMLGLSRNASYSAAKRGDLPTIKIGKLLRVPKRHSIGCSRRRARSEHPRISR